MVVPGVHVQQCRQRNLLGGAKVRLKWEPVFLPHDEMPVPMQSEVYMVNQITFPISMCHA